jgi:hypothetical protein
VTSLVLVTAVAVLGSAVATGRPAAAAVSATTASAAEAVTSGSWGAVMSASSTGTPPSGALVLGNGSTLSISLNANQIVYLDNVGSLPLSAVSITVSSAGSLLPSATLYSCPTAWSGYTCPNHGSGTQVVSSSGTAVQATLTTPLPVGGQLPLVLQVSGIGVGLLVPPSVTVSVSVGPTQVRAATTTNS